MDSGKSSATGSPLSLDSGASTDRGLHRETNEDSLLAEYPVFAVADGMGGHESGEIASGICIRTLQESGLVGQPLVELKAEQLRSVLAEADANIRAATGGRAGTTVTGAVLGQEAGSPAWLVFNVGDSRTYRFSRGVLEQLTVDHSEVQELVDGGHISAEAALVHPRRHVVTRALGTGGDLEADVWLMPALDGDRLLICSDGLVNEVGDEAIFEILVSVADPQEASDALVKAALSYGGRDNISVIVVDARATGGGGGSGRI